MKNLEIELNQLIKEKKRIDSERLAENFEKSMLLWNRILGVERLICRNKGVEYAEPYDFGIESFFDMSLDANLNSATIKVNDMAIKFSEVIELCFGGINDELFDSHVYKGMGMDICGSFIIKNSSWVKRLQNQNSIHNCYDENYWIDFNHYIIRVKDGEFSCVAKGWKLIEPVKQN